MNKPKCSECIHCSDHRRLGNTRGRFHCEHPDYEYIRKYFESHNITCMPRFICFGKCFESKPSIKSCPRWFPLLKGESQNEKQD